MAQATTSKFEQAYRIGVYNDFPAVMDYIQQASLHHTLSSPGGLEELDEADLVWVLTHWKVAINALPSTGEDVTVSTWPVNFKGYFGERGFEMKKQGKSLIVANSNWMLLKRSSLSPARPNAAMLAKYGQVYPFLIQKDFALPKAAEFELVAEHTCNVSRRDIDNNNHVNNISYLKWVWDILPDELYNTTPKVFKAVYKKESRLGDSLCIKLYRQADELFALIEKDGKTSVEIYISWEEKH